MSSHALINRYLLNLQRPKKQLGQKPAPPLSWVPRSLGPVRPCYNQCQPWNCRESKIHLKTSVAHGQSRHCQESRGCCWVGGHTEGRRTQRPALASGTGHTHTLTPSIFLCYSSCGPQQGKREAPGNIPSQSDVAHSVRARRKPPAAQSDSKINTNSDAEAELLCRTSWRDTSVGASTHWERRDPGCCTVSRSVPVSIPEGIPCPVPAERRSQALALCCCGSLSWTLSIFRACLLPQASTALQTSRFGLVCGVEWGVPPQGCWGIPPQACCDLLASAVPLKVKQESDPKPQCVTWQSA